MLFASNWGTGKGLWAGGLPQHGLGGPMGKGEWIGMNRWMPPITGDAPIPGFMPRIESNPPGHLPQIFAQ